MLYASISLFLKWGNKNSQLPGQNKTIVCITMRVNYVNDFLMYVSMSISLIHLKILYYFIFLWSVGIGGADVTNPIWQMRELSVQMIWLTYLRYHY